MVRVNRFANVYRSAAVNPSDLWTALQFFGLKGWVATIPGTVSAFVLLGVPTALIKNPYFTRMIPAKDQDYVIWIASSLLIGLVIGTFAISTTKGGGGKTMGSGFLTVLAVGCPICNKLVIVFLGISGALSYFEPMQLYLGVGSVVLLVWTLLLRSRSMVGTCPI